MIKNSVWRLCFLCVVCFCNAAPSIYLSVIKNDTPRTLYKIIVPEEDYEILLPAGTQKNLGAWFDLRRGNELQLAVLQGDGEPIFIHMGPESSGCHKNDMANSVIFWTGEPEANSGDKVYQTYCQSDRDMKLELCVEPDGTPVVNEIKD